MLQSTLLEFNEAVGTINGYTPFHASFVTEEFTSRLAFRLVFSNLPPAWTRRKLHTIAKW